MMTWRDLVPSSALSKCVHGVEADPLRRRRPGSIGGVIALAGGSASTGACVPTVAASGSHGYLEKLRRAFGALFRLEWGKLVRSTTASTENVLATAGVVLIVAGIAIYLLYRWTGFLRKDAE